MKKTRVLIMGDFNARVGRDFDVSPGTLGRHGVGNCIGRLLLELCAEQGLCINNPIQNIAVRQFHFSMDTSFSFTETLTNIISDGLACE